MAAEVAAAPATRYGPDPYPNIFRFICFIRMSSRAD